MQKFTHCDRTLKLVYDYERTVNFTLRCYAFCRNFLRASYVRLVNVNLIEVDSSLIKFIKIQIAVFFSLLQSGTMLRRVYKHLSSALCLEVSTCNIFFTSFFMHQLYRICLQDC